MPRLFRPPYGLYNGATLRAANQCRIGAVIEWTATMANGRLSVVGGRLLPGDIVLLHFRPDLYENLQQLIGTIARDGLTVGRLESYLAFQTA